MKSNTELITRCFPDLQCDNYTFAMWLKFSQTTLASGQKAVFSSARQGTQVTNGGIELLVVDGELRVHFKRTENTTRWRANTNITGQHDKWIHITGTWSVKRVAHLYIDGILKATGKKITNTNQCK